jgi:pyridoxal phosphate enzyme (YggS family)
MSSSVTFIAENLKSIRERIARAAAAAGRRLEEITLIGISKTHPAESIREAYNAGLRHFGENRVQEWEGKQSQLKDLDARWHLVGHLQSNKSARASKQFHSIDSVDSLDLARKLSQARADSSSPLPILLEIRMDTAPAKTGINPNELERIAEGVITLPHIHLRGLMCVPPFSEDPQQSRLFFRQLRELRDALASRLGIPIPTLSMGMSHDFEVAIQEGATEVRVGAAIFGSRPSA